MVQLSLIMLTEDYLMRMIRLAVAAIAKAVGLRAATLYTDALFVLSHALQQVTGFTSGMLARMSDNSLLAALSGPGGPDPDRLIMTADLIMEEAAIYDSIQDPVEAGWRRLRALILYLEAVLTGEPEYTTPPDPQIQSILEKVSLDHLPENVQYPLYLYLDKSGLYRSANQVLQDLLEGSGRNPDLVSDARDFYTRLLRQSDQELQAGGLAREEIKLLLARL